MDNEKENLDSSTEETETTDSSNSEQESNDEGTETEKEEYTEREKQYYARIKKLEKELDETKKSKSPEVKTDSTGLTTKDLLALSKANLDDEDFDEVMEFSSFKKLSVSEALKSPTLKAILAEKAELRKSAQAVNTGTSRRGTTGISDERLLSDARKGILPDNEDDIARLTRLKLQKK